MATINTEHIEFTKKQRDAFAAVIIGGILCAHYPKTMKTVRLVLRGIEAIKDELESTPKEIVKTAIYSETVDTALSHLPF